MHFCNQGPEAKLVTDRLRGKRTSGPYLQCYAGEVLRHLFKINGSPASGGVVEYHPILFYADKNDKMIKIPVQYARSFKRIEFMKIER